ncbi:MAG: hypothetical protein CL916_05390, partial [Deltaproteobacteria bacterium]|nr:hypothetical protein [Deltaproteobacteria bacterium]
MSGELFQKVMRGTYISGLGYSGWTEEVAKTYIADFNSSIPKVSDSKLQRNKKSYTLTWSEGKESYKALFSLEEDAFGGPVYRSGDIVLLSSKVESKPLEKSKSPAKGAKGKAEKEKATSASWKSVDNGEGYVA